MVAMAYEVPFTSATACLQTAPPTAMSAMLAVSPLTSGDEGSALGAGVSVMIGPGMVVTTVAVAVTVTAG
jgi:hypothetical protein